MRRLLLIALVPALLGGPLLVACGGPSSADREAQRNLRGLYALIGRLPVPEAAEKPGRTASRTCYDGEVCRFAAYDCIDRDSGDEPLVLIRYGGDVSWEEVERTTLVAIESLPGSRRLPAADAGSSLRRATYRLG